MRWRGETLTDANLFLLAAFMVRAGVLTESGLTGDAQSIYDQLVDEVTWPDRIADQGYLAVMVLPVASLYQALRKRGWAQPDAVHAVESAFLASGAPQRRLFKLMLGTDLGRRLFLRSLRPPRRDRPPRRHMMSASPHLRIAVSSMATGADRCRICFERQPEDTA